MPKVSGCGQIRLAAAYRSYMRGIDLKRKLEYIDKAGLYQQLASCYYTAIDNNIIVLCNTNINYMKQYYSECYNRDI